MVDLRETYRGCEIGIQISERALRWDITITVTPRDGVELIEPPGSRKLKLAKAESLDLITRELLSEVRRAIDLDIVES
ncbi:hypothetical protein [Pandoraea sp. PE-S2R-1]|uniref:hypothetical protein n=1 Tax=Pandoraea sp. PE-S2R-1 TaxID=1986994 RepID=UPI000B3FB5A0|nr:hypothetical protein [Pandoraea sp. PE-S2R-1]